MSELRKLFFFVMAVLMTALIVDLEYIGLAIMNDWRPQAFTLVLVFGAAISFCMLEKHVKNEPGRILLAFIWPLTWAALGGTNFIRVGSGNHQFPQDEIRSGWTILRGATEYARLLAWIYALKLMGVICLLPFGIMQLGRWLLGPFYFNPRLLPSEEAVIEKELKWQSR